MCKNGQVTRFFFRDALEPDDEAAGGVEPAPPVEFISEPVEYVEVITSRRISFEPIPVAAGDEIRLTITEDSSVLTVIEADPD